MDAKEFLMTCVKECRSHSSCGKCKFLNEGRCMWRPFTRDESDREVEQRVDRAISIAEKLSHIKTYADDFFEKFPNAKKEDGLPVVCRNYVYGLIKPACANDALCSKCWNETIPEEDNA